MKHGIFLKLKNHTKSLKPKKAVDMLFVSYIVLIIVPILLLGSAFMMISAHQNLEQSQSVRVSVLENAAELLREKIDTIYNASYNIMCNADVLRYEEYQDLSLEKSLALTRIENSLQRLMAQTDVISEIFIYYKNSDASVNATGEKREFKNIYEMFDMNRHEFCTFLLKNNGKIISLATNTPFYGQKSYVMYIKSVDRKRKPGNIFEICLLDSKLIQGIINDVTIDGAGSAALLDDNYNCILCTDGADSAEYKLPDKSFLKQVSSEQYETARLGSKKIKYLIKDVPLTDLKIFSVVNSSFYMLKLRYVWVLILIICAFIIAMGIWVARIYSRRIYRPITNIINLFKPSGSDDLEKSELKFIESKFKEINEMRYELTEYKDTYSSYLKENFVYKFIKGYISDSTDFKNRLNDFNVRIVTEHHTVILIKIDRLREVGKNIELYHFQSYVKESFVEAFEKFCKGKYDSLHEFYDNEYIGIIVCHDEDIDFEDCLRQIQRYISQKLDITISLCVGTAMVAWEDLPKSYEKLYLCMLQNSLCGYEFLKFSDENVTTNRYINFSKYDEIISRCIDSQSYDRLDELIDEIFNHDAPMYNEIVQLFNSFIITLMSIINKSGYSANDILMNIKPYTDVKKFETTSQLADYLKKVCRMVGDSIANSEKDKRAMLVNINKYFEQNYMEQITLESIAKEFGFSPGYFSRYFKEITGKKYIEYLNSYRIDKAKELIRTDKTAKLLVVSEKVGFVRYRTFLDAFKKYAGQSPDSFKRGL